MAIVRPRPTPPKKNLPIIPLRSDPLQRLDLEIDYCQSQCGEAFNHLAPSDRVDCTVFNQKFSAIYGKVSAAQQEAVASSADQYELLAPASLENGGISGPRAIAECLNSANEALRKSQIDMVKIIPKLIIYLSTGGPGADLIIHHKEIRDLFKKMLWSRDKVSATDLLLVFPALKKVYHNILTDTLKEISDAAMKAISSELRRFRCSNSLKQLSIRCEIQASIYNEAFMAITGEELFEALKGVNISSKLRGLTPRGFMKFASFSTKVKTVASGEKIFVSGLKAYSGSSEMAASIISKNPVGKLSLKGNIIADVGLENIGGHRRYILRIEGQIMEANPGDKIFREIDDAYNLIQKNRKIADAQYAKELEAWNKDYANGLEVSQRVEAAEAAELAAQTRIEIRAKELAALPANHPLKQSLDSIVLVHGTSSAALGGAEAIKPMLRSSGELIRSNRPLFSGELGAGLWQPNGVSKTMISTIAIDEIGEPARFRILKNATDLYAVGGQGTTFEQEAEALSNALRRIELGGEQGSEFLVRSGNIETRVRMANLRTLDPARFTAEIMPKLSDGVFEKIVANANKKGLDIRLVVDTVKAARDQGSQIVLSQGDRKLIANKFRVIFGSTNKDQAIRTPIRSDITGEVGVKAMDIGAGGFDCIFVDKENIAKVIEWAKSRGLSDQIADGRLKIMEIEDLLANQKAKSLLFKK